MPGTAHRARVALLLLAATLVAHSDETAVPDDPKRIILETDMTFDVDDVLSLIHI